MSEEKIRHIRKRKEDYSNPVEMKCGTKQDFVHSLYAIGGSSQDYKEATCLECLAIEVKETEEQCWKTYRRHLSVQWDNE